MSFNEFKAEVLKLDASANISNTNGMVYLLAFKSYWARFPESRADKFEEVLNNLKHYKKY